MSLIENQEDNKSFKDDKMFKNNADEFPIITKKRIFTKIIIIALLLFIIILIGIIVICLSLKKEEPNPEKEESNPEKEESKMCDIGEGEKCQNCSYINKNECSTCNLGYFLPENDTIRQKCHKCSIKNCKICEGTINDNTCTQCDYYLEPVIVDKKITKCNYTCQKGEECKTCGEKENICISCNDGYKLSNGKCIPSSFFINATYRTQEPYKKIYIFGWNFPMDDIIEMKIDDTKIDVPSRTYNFSSEGNHYLYMLVKNNETEDFSYIFSEVENLVSVSFDPKLKKIEIINMRSMFNKCKSLESINLSNLNTEKVIDMGYLFNNCNSLKSLDLSNFKTTNVEDMQCLFFGCNSLTSIDLSHFNTSNVSNMKNMFSSCYNLKSLNFKKNFDTQKVTNMDSMFSSSYSLISLDLSNFNTTNVNEMHGMFTGCRNLTSINVNNFNTQNVKDMSNMFSSCINLKSLNLSNFDTSKVTNMGKMFSDSGLKILDISHFEWNYTENCTIFESFYNSNLSITINLDFFNNNKDVIIARNSCNWEIIFINN